MAENDFTSTLIKESSLFSQPDKKGSAVATDKGNDTETDELPEVNDLADPETGEEDHFPKDNDLESDINAIKTLPNLDHKSALTAYDIAIKKYVANVFFHDSEYEYVFSKETIVQLQPVLTVKTELVKETFYKALSYLLDALNAAVTADLQLSLLTKVFGLDIFWPTIAKTMGFLIPSPNLDRSEMNSTPFHLVRDSDRTAALSSFNEVINIYKSNVEDLVLELAKTEARRQYENLVTAYANRFKGKLNSDLFNDIEQEISVQLVNNGDESRLAFTISMERKYLMKSFDVLADYLIVFAKNHACQQNKILIRALFAFYDGKEIITPLLPTLDVTYKIHSSEVVLSTVPAAIKKPKAATVSFSSTDKPLATASDYNKRCNYDTNGCTTYDCPYFHYESLGKLCIRKNCKIVGCKMRHDDPTVQLSTSNQRKQSTAQNQGKRQGATTSDKTDKKARHLEKQAPKR